MKCITHPYIRKDSLESREYQLSVAMRALDGNTMVVLPTGLGKTAIALIVAASRLYNEGGKVLVMAPTKPLAEQHLRFFEKFLALPSDGTTPPRSALFTGDTPPEERAEEWEASTLIFATPQVIKNDIIAGSYSLDDVSLLVVDECHRAVGNYAYVFIAQRYLNTAAGGRILAMTASPGGHVEKVQEVCSNLGIQIVETRSEEDPDVSPYVHEREIEVISVDLPDELKSVSDDLNTLLDMRLAKIERLHFQVPKRQQLSMRSLNELNSRIQERIQQRDPEAYAAASLYAECMKLRHAISLAESQGSRVLSMYVTKLFHEGASAGGSKASQRLAQDPYFIRLHERCSSWKCELHPKMDLIGDITRTQLEESPGSRIIIFATYRDTVQQIVDFLTDRGIRCERFVGQASKDSEKGLSQKKQLEALRKFREGEFRVLVATSVGEEGLDVPSTDMVIFYEAVPSEIRSIQRKGRTGRSGRGKIVVLVTKGTTDETFRYVSQQREKAMAAGMKRLKSSSGGSSPSTLPLDGPSAQSKIEAFTEEGPHLFVDDRETASKVVEVLSDMGAAITLQRLEQGDYAIGDRIVIERKTVRDFVDTLVDRDLIGQLRALASAAPRPVLIIEGQDIYTQRDIHPNAIRGTLAAITVDLGISLLYSRDESDTAQMIFILAKREGEPASERRLAQRKSYQSLQEQQELIIAAFPDIGLKNARLLLDHFGSIQSIINAELEELCSVKGIGEGKAGHIHEISRRAYDQGNRL
jgi:ERCC4-related helicase